MVKISIIVPVYNGEKYVRACLDSIINQTLEDIEIIVIDDKSVDNTRNILKEYENNYSEKIKIIEKEQNEGQGSARNIGIKLATGQFITFVDSDDTIQENMLEKMYEASKKNSSEVVICDYYEITEGKKEIKKAIPKKKGDIVKDYITSVAGPCNKLIRTKLLKENDLIFLEKGIYEDIAMIPLIALYANKISYLEEPLYNYYIRKGSTMRQEEFNNKLLCIYNALEALENGFINAHKKDEYFEELEFIYIKHLLYAGSRKIFRI